MKFGNKDFSFYWKMIMIPTYILVGWSVLGFIASLTSFSIYTSVWTPLSGWVLTVAVFGFIGWTVIKDNNGDLKTCSWSGALVGGITGFVGAVISILMINFVPNVVSMAVAQAAQKGMDAATVTKFIEIGAYIGLFTGPLISAVIGALISLFGGFIATKVK